MEKDKKEIFNIYTFFIFLTFLIFSARLADLQLIKGDYFKKLADNNRLRRLKISAQRGDIIARGGDILATDREVIKEVVFDEEEGFKKVEKGKADKALIEIKEWRREYPYKEVLAHVIGFLGEAEKNQVDKPNPSCPEKGIVKLGQVIGKAGIEKEYECELAGEDGEMLIEIDSAGKNIRPLGERQAKKGKDLRINISLGLQKKAYDLLQGRKGAIIATDLNGEVLALVSSPSFDPNLFNDPSTNTLAIQKLLKDEDKPFFNRVISGIYHPGSVFKPFVALVALQEGVIEKNFLYNDEGFILLDTPYGKFRYSNWYFDQYGKKEGSIDLRKALARSTDTFFYRIGEKLGVERIKKWAEIFSLTKKTGIDLPGEVEGIVPDPLWKERIKGEKWFLGNTYHLSIGQGDLSLTPIMINQLTSIIASGGRVCLPQIVRKTSRCENLKGLDKENIDFVKEGMRMACEKGGTAFPFFDSNYKVGCKTGTAETKVGGKTHAWFTVFAPFEKPEIVITVLIEEGGEGSSAAAPIARALLDYWFGQKD